MMTKAIAVVVLIAALTGSSVAFAQSLTGPQRDAVRSARNYLSVMGFSCDGLIEQLSSEMGSKYTNSQATFGARQAGAC